VSKGSRNSLSKQKERNYPEGGTELQEFQSLSTPEASPEADGNLFILLLFLSFLIYNKTIIKFCFRVIFKLVTGQNQSAIWSLYFYTYNMPRMRQHFHEITNTHMH
jgi:hypothetical protein